MVEWQYIVLFLISLIPFLDVFSVIPVSIALGMSPIAVAIISFLGNFIMVMGYARFFIQISEWLTKRRAKKEEKSRSYKNRNKSQTYLGKARSSSIRFSGSFHISDRYNYFTDS